MQDKFLNISLSIGFTIVALIYFYEDYAPLLDLNFGTNTTPETEFDYEPPKPEDNAVIDSPNPNQPPPPVLAEIPDFHTIQSGETIYGIARQYGLNVDELVILNPGKIKNTGLEKDGLPIYEILPGEQLLLKKKINNDLTVLNKASDFLESLNCQDYLCPHSKKELKKHQKALKALNSSTTKLLLQRLSEIDKNYYSNGYRKDQFKLVEHKVRKGESVYDIALKYDVPISDIPKYNPNTVKAKMVNGTPKVDKDGKVEYDIMKDATIIVFEKIK